MWHAMIIAYFQKNFHLLLTIFRMVYDLVSFELGIENTNTFIKQEHFFKNHGHSFIQRLLFKMQ